MPTRRGLGRGMMAASAILSDWAMKELNNREASRRQIADDERAAAARKDADERVARLTRETDYLRQNPTALAANLGRLRPNLDVAAPISEQITKADDISKMPTDEDVQTQYDTSGGRRTLSSENISGSMSNLLRTPNRGGEDVLNSLLAQAKSKRDALTTEAEIPDTSVEITNNDGSKTTQFVSKRKGGQYTTGLSARRTGELKGEETLAAVPGQVEATNKTEAGTRSARAASAGAIARAEADARNASEWSPAIVEKKLEFEKQKRIGELLQIGDKVQAEEVGKRNAAIKGLLPTYQQYRQLASDVVTSWAGAKSETAGSAVNALSHVPVIGEFLASTLESGHGVSVDALEALPGMNSDLGKKISELNKLTDTLAQGMANAVLGNKGQTTENDRRTAKNILVTSFTGVNTAKDLIAITDRMFTILPTVSAEVLRANPNATPAEILTAMEARAKEATKVQFGDFIKPPEPSPASKKLSAARQGAAQTAHPNLVTAPPKITASEKLQRTRARAAQNQARR